MSVSISFGYIYSIFLLIIKLSNSICIYMIIFESMCIFHISHFSFLFRRLCLSYLLLFGGGG